MRKLFFLMCATLAIFGCSGDEGDFPCLGCEEDYSEQFYGSCTFYNYGKCEDNVSQDYCYSNGGTFNYYNDCPSETYKLTIHTEPEIGGYVSTNNYVYGTVVTIAATPREGYKFLRWSGDYFSNDSSIQVTMNGDRTVTAEFELLTYKLTTNVTPSKSGEILRNPDNSIYTHGTNVTLTATSYSGYKFIGWFGDVSSTNETIQVTMDKAKTITAEYTTAYTLTTSASSGGTVSISSSSSYYAYGTKVTVTATPSYGYAFTGWSGASTSTDTQIQITMDANKTLYATFVPTYTLTTGVTSGNGSISRSPSLTNYPQGTSVTVTATPSTGYKFVSWSGASNSTSTSVSITMNENKTLSAKFELLTYALTTNASTGGTVSKSPSSTSYNHGTSVTVTATPNSNYRFVGWSGASSSTSTSINITMDEAKSVTAMFEYAVIRSTFTDYRGVSKNYKTVQIGTQTWMAENLNYEVEGSKCYNDDTDNCNTYGRLYDWATAMGFDQDCNSTTCSDQIEDPHQGICPDGWHIPSDAEWSTLETFVEGSSTAGRYLKSQSGWSSCGPVGSNNTYVCEDIYGVAALPGGYGFSDGIFFNVGYYGNWWSATEYDAYFAYYRYMYYNGEDVSRSDNFKAYLQSVRCVQD